MRWVLILMSFLASPALANESVGCQDIWFTRNLVMDRAGYCFASRLGKAIFDNSDCTGKNVSIDEASTRLVGQIQALEAAHGCAIDTSRRTTLDLDDLSIRRRLIDLPVFDEFPGGCLGWNGPETSLSAGRNGRAAVIGRIEPGDFVSITHIPVDGWTYVTVSGPGWGALKSGGWFEGDMRHMQCEAFAG